MLVERAEPWGKISYDTSTHTFACVCPEEWTSGPYSREPTLLNVVLTRQCNMDCRHCVAADFRGVQDEELVVGDELLAWVNSQPFLVVVITGGEPLLVAKREQLGALLTGLREKGLIVDTNGTVVPDDGLLAIMKAREVLLRISLDSIRPQYDAFLRHTRGARTKEQRTADFERRMENIEAILKSGVQTAIQTVIYRKSQTNPGSGDNSLQQMACWLKDVGISKWYLQRLIPSHRFKRPGPDYTLTTGEYENTIDRLKQQCDILGIDCITKRDRRHNSVILLHGAGDLYTQGAKPGQKVYLGSIRDSVDYFTCVSASDHATRYYSPHE